MTATIPGNWDGSTLMNPGHFDAQWYDIIVNLPIPTAIFDREFRYIGMSDRWKSDYDLVGKDFVGHSHFELFPNIPVRWKNIFNEALKGKTLKADFDLVERSNGEKVWLRWSCQPWRNERKEIAGLVVMAENITKQVESQIRMTQDSKMKAIGQMAGGVAHEINNPLAVIMLNADLINKYLEDEVPDREKLLVSSSRIKETVIRISKIVKGLRMISRETREGDPLEELVAVEVIEETAELCRGRMNEHNIEFEVDYCGLEEKSFFGRSADVGQIILNLLNNAVDAVGGLKTKKISLRMFEKNKGVAFQVIDSGPGIPNEYRPKLMTPFFTTKPSGQGTGLGLSLSRALAQSCGGELKFIEDAEKTTFELWLPSYLPDHMAEVA